jgi:hypothetical protein
MMMRIDPIRHSLSSPSFARPNIQKQPLIAT